MRCYSKCALNLRRGRTPCGTSRSTECLQFFDKVWWFRNIFPKKNGVDLRRRRTTFCSFWRWVDVREWYGIGIYHDVLRFRLQVCSSDVLLLTKYLADTKNFQKIEYSIKIWNMVNELQACGYSVSELEMKHALHRHSEFSIKAKVIKSTDIDYSSVILSFINIEKIMGEWASSQKQRL